MGASMKVPTKLASLALAASLSVVASGASATTADFTIGGTDLTGQSLIDFGDFTVTAIAGGFLNDGAKVTQVGGSDGGLAVNGNPDIQPGQVDNFPNDSYEGLIFTFDQEVELTGFNLNLFDVNGLLDPNGDDDFTLYVDGSYFGTSGSGSWAGSILLTSFIIGVTPDLVDQACFGRLCVDLFDDFRVADISYEVKAIPLPAPALLLLGALGGLGAIRRRKKAA